MPHGATPRKLEPDRWRSTTEGGFPRYELWDTEGVPVVSINDRSREYPHAPEYKPAPADFAQDVGVLNSGVASAVRHCESDRPRLGMATARPPGLYVYSATDDVADYFMHLGTAPELWWYSTYAVLAQDGDVDVELGRAWCRRRG